MIRWIKKCLRAWLLDPDEPPKFLQIISKGQIVNAFPIAVSGMYLVCGDGSGGEFLVSSMQAVDESKFWAVWKRLQPGKVTWEDGTEFNPTDE